MAVQMEAMAVQMEAMAVQMEAMAVQMEAMAVQMEVIATVAALAPRRWIMLATTVRIPSSPSSCTKEYNGQDQSNKCVDMNFVVCELFSLPLSLLCLTTNVEL